MCLIPCLWGVHFEKIQKNINYLNKTRVYEVFRKKELLLFYNSSFLALTVHDLTSNIFPHYLIFIVVLNPVDFLKSFLYFVFLLFGTWIIAFLLIPFKAFLPTFFKIFDLITIFFSLADL